MKVYVNVKQLGRRKNNINKVPFIYESAPKNVRELITYTVTLMVESYQKRAEYSVLGKNPRALSEKEIEARAEFGRIAFGFVYGKSGVNMDEAISTAIQAYEDGLVRIFAGDTEVGGLDDAITLHEEDELTFVRLAMLAGRMW